MGLISGFKKAKAKVSKWSNDYEFKQQINAEKKARSLEAKADKAKKLRERIERQEKAQKEIAKSKKKQWESSPVGKIFKGFEGMNKSTPDKAKKKGLKPLKKKKSSSDDLFGAGDDFFGGSSGGRGDSGLFGDDDPFK